MKIAMIGVTGLLGYQGALELTRRGHQIVGIALPPVPPELVMPDTVKLKLGNYLELSEAELLAIFQGCEGFIFAAGVDERVEGPPPIYDLYKKYNIDALERLLAIARTAGVKKVVVLGSYFAYFAKQWPELELAQHHPYIRSRLEQEKLAFSYAEPIGAPVVAPAPPAPPVPGMDVAVLELPYIFGAQKSRKPVWLFIAEMIQNTKGKRLFYPKGGTTMVTVRQVGEAIAGALEQTEGAQAYPVGWYNMTWKTWLEQFSADMGQPKKVVTIPNFLFKIAARGMKKKIERSGHESGLEMIEFVKLMTAETYIDKQPLVDLGVQPDDINQAIKESVDVCLDILQNPDKPVVEMKAE